MIATQGNRKFTANFKKVSDKASPRVGLKRESFVVEYATPAVAEISAGVLEIIVCDAIERLAKQMIADNGSDWDYRPAFASLTAEKVAEELSKPDSRGSRIFTAANIAAFAALYEVVMVQDHGKTDSQAKTGAEVLRTKLATVMAQPKILAGMLGNILLVCESEKYTLAVAENAAIEAVAAKFVDMITEIQEAAVKEVTEDDI